MIITISIIGFLILLSLSLIIFYNALIRGRNMVEEAWSGISVQLKRRHDLIPLLVNTIKGYTSHESSVLEKLTKARVAAISAPKKDVSAVMQVENGLAQALRSLFAVSENYPQLMASENFIQLQQQLAELEDEIQMARRYYNGTSRDQNNRVQQFPGNLIAPFFGFRKVDYFELDDEAERAVPDVNF